MPNENETKLLQQLIENLTKEGLDSQRVHRFLMKHRANPYLMKLWTEALKAKAAKKDGQEP